MLDEFGRVVTRPFREEVPVTTLFAYIAIYLIAAWIIYDMLRILSSWMAQST